MKQENIWMLSVDIEQIPLTEVTNRKHYRIVPSRFPTIDLFESLVEPDDLDVLFEIESMTNDRLREQVGEISLVSASERLTGPGASPVMAAFTHIDQSSRFTDGSYGIYYAGLSECTAIMETKFHKEQFLMMTNEGPCKIEMRCYVGELNNSFHDIRSEGYQKYQSQDTNTYPLCQALALSLKGNGSDGLYYQSARDPDGECIAAFKPTAVGYVSQSKHYEYVWDGTQINSVLEMKQVFSS